MVDGYLDEEESRPKGSCSRDEAGMGRHEREAGKSAQGKPPRGHWEQIDISHLYRFRPFQPSASLYPRHADRRSASWLGKLVCETFPTGHPRDRPTINPYSQGSASSTSSPASCQCPISRTLGDVLARVHSSGFPGGLTFGIKIPLPQHPRTPPSLTARLSGCLERSSFPRTAWIGLEGAQMIR